MQIDLVKTYQFEAAHATPWENDPARLHGHSFEVEVVVGGACGDESGWLMDYADISDCFDPVFRKLDHKTLNDVDGLDDVTIRGIARWIRDELAPGLPLLKDVHLSVRGDQIYAPKLLHRDTVHDLSERIRFSFEAAHALPKLPPDHKCHTMHGHSFSVEAGADEAEQLTPVLHRIHETLDHRCLNDIAGLENPTSEQLGRWIWREVVESVSGLSVVVVAETCTARCIYRGK